MMLGTVRRHVQLLILTAVILWLNSSPNAATASTKPLLARLVGGKITVMADGLSVQAQPGSLYIPFTTAPVGIVLDALARTADTSWIKVQAGARMGWVATASIALDSSAASLPVEQIEQPATDPTNNCVTMVGDSIETGEQPFVIPEVGVLTAYMTSVTTHLAAKAAAVGLAGMDIREFATSGKGVSALNHPLYYFDPYFDLLLNDSCKFVIVFPWINDLSTQRPPGIPVPALHAAALAKMITVILDHNPYQRVLVLNYYHGMPADFSVSYAWGFTNANIDQFNREIDRQCKDGPLARVQVTCLDSDSLLAAAKVPFVSGATSLKDVEADLTAPPTAQEQAMLDYFARIHPGAPIIGDGIHLNVTGRDVLAAALLKEMLALPPLYSLPDLETRGERRHGDW